MQYVGEGWWIWLSTNLPVFPKIIKISALKQNETNTSYILKFLLTMHCKFYLANILCYIVRFISVNYIWLVTKTLGVDFVIPYKYCYILIVLIRS